MSDQTATKASRMQRIYNYGGIAIGTLFLCASIKLSSDANDLSERNITTVSNALQANDILLQRLEEYTQEIQNLNIINEETSHRLFECQMNMVPLPEAPDKDKVKPQTDGHLFPI